ncbi:MAG: efflux transporter outer membrane subunit [Gammaproteobacteria bacterium]|nr:efflux transporter outer membrane subunit [Gammaproteobacteria bacterium]
MTLADLRKKFIPVIALISLSACAVGPDYKRPEQEAPTAFKEMQGWKQAEPRDHELRGNWWEMFGDPLLNSLEQQVNISNQNLAQAAAQFRQAAALVPAARASFFPTVTSGVSRTRTKSPDTRTSSSSTSSTAIEPVTTDTLNLNVIWEADVWGRVQRTVEANEAGALASAADLEAVRLLAQATLAQSYFQLRIIDAQQKLLDDTVAAYERSLQLANNQYAAGVVSRADVIQAQTLLKTTQAQAIDLGVQRAQLEHAIALLIGKPPSAFSLAPTAATMAQPAIPVGLPSELLERRPDIAAAERRVAAANAQIGVAKAAYFPSLTLNATGGYQDTGVADWISLPNRFWSIGPALAQTLFDGGLRRSQTDQAIAAYDASVAVYRQAVLNGFKEVEDNLAALRILQQEAQVQDEAVKSAHESLAIITNQYKAGTVSYLDVVAVQTAALNNERTQTEILGRQLIASVLLIKALGGGWKAAAIP